MSPRSRFQQAPGRSAVVAALLIAAATAVHAQPDTRIRTVTYSPDEVYRLSGYAGYQIDLQFAPQETFTGLAAGDIDGLSFSAEGNHLFLKPKAAKVDTNLTVLTSRRTYHFEYSASRAQPDPDVDDVIYVLRFAYPDPPVRAPSVATSPATDEIGRALAQAAASRPRNYDYWYCGSTSLQPVAAWDDGVHTWLRFGARTELPAIFVRNEDGSESLLNFDSEDGDVVVHRVARQFVLRRGGLQGCITNRMFAGNGVRLRSGTVAPAVERTTVGAAPATGRVP